MALFIGFSISYGASSNSANPIDQQKAIEKIREKQKENIEKINQNTTFSAMQANVNGKEVIPKNSNSSLECQIGTDKHLHCQKVNYTLPIVKPGIYPVESKKEPVVPQPKQYKNVFKAIATVMYMFAFVYFLIQISMEAYRKRYVQALALLLMFLVGTSILYIAYKAVFNAP
jgi:archaellum component FlaF (FlaF/FlaG flagellin family)